METSRRGNGIVARRDLNDLADLSFVTPGPMTQAEHAFPWEQAARTIRGNGIFILACIGVLISVFVLVAFLMRDTYQPTARLEIDPPGTGIRTLHEIDSNSPSDDQDYLDTQVQILQSDSLATKVIRTLGLDQKREFAGNQIAAKAAAPTAPVGAATSERSKSDGFLQDQLELAERSTSESAALGVLRKHLTVTPVRGTRLVEVSYASHDPAQAQLVTNTLVQQFIEQNHRNRYTSTMEASGWLSTQLNDLREKVEQSNRAVADYQRRYNLVEMDEHDLPMGELMNGVSHQLSDAEANRIEAEAYVRMVNAGESEAIPAFRNDQVYQNLLTQYGQVRAQLAEARAVYGDENSNVKKLTDEANELSQQVEAERARMATQLRASFEAALDRERMMLDSRKGLLSQMGDASSHLVEYRILKNEALSNAELYNTLQARLREAGIYAGLGSDNIHVVDLAPKLRRATSPNRPLIIAVGAVLSCMFAVVFAFVRESFDNTVRSPDDIRESTGLPSLAMVPALENANSQTPSSFGLSNLVRERRSPVRSTQWIPLGTMGAEALRHLRASLMLMEAKARPHVILVSSASAGEGKSTVALNLAVALAEHRKTCLVEADVRRLPTDGTARPNPKPGLANVLEGAASLDDVLVQLPQSKRLMVLPSGTRPTNPADLIGSEQMSALISDLRKRFDEIVIDSPPVIPFSEARTLSSLSDAVVLVSRYRSTTRRALARCLQLLEEVHAPVVGVVLNGIALSSADYRYFNYGYGGTWYGGSSAGSADFPAASDSSQPKAKAKSSGA
jgi:polysaccharide biosynthesis transport protein